MRKAGDYVPRRAADLVLAALSDTRVVIVNGARQAGTLPSGMDQSQQPASISTEEGV